VPNRILKESICTSETINQLTDAEEAFFYRLLVICDDYGRMDARPEVLLGRLYPLRIRQMDPDTIAERLAALERVGLLQIYEVDGRPYLQIGTWDKHQQKRAKQSKFPSPPSDDSICNQVQSDDDNGLHMSPRNEKRESRIENRESRIENRETRARAREEHPPTDPLSQIVEVVQSIPRWPVDDEKDRATAEELIEEFGVARVLEASRDLRTWTRDHPLKAGDKPRARWRNFCKPRPAKTNTPRASPAGGLPKAGLPEELRRLPILAPDGRIIPTTPNYRGPMRWKPPPDPEETDDDPKPVQEGRAPPAWPN